VSRLGFKVQTASQTSIFRDFNGQEFEATEIVTVPLRGRMPKSQHIECFIAPTGFPLPGIVIGSRFTYESGPAKILFLDKPADPSFLMMQSQKLVGSPLEQ
jgi:hypothetical protein